MRVANERRTGWLWSAVALIAALAAGGCASGGGTAAAPPDDAQMTRAQLAEVGRAIAEVRDDIRELRAALQTLGSELDGIREAQLRQASVLEAIEDLRVRTGAIEKRVVQSEAMAASVHARMGTAEARVGDAESRVNALAETLTAMELTLAGLADQVARLEALPVTPIESAPGVPPPAARSGPAPAPPPPSSIAVLAADELFNRAMENYRNGELGQAILDFEDFLAKHPSHALAGNAQFWIGEAYFQARDYQHAATEYRKVLDLAPKGEKTPDALFKLGLAYRSLQRNDRARETWGQLLRDFPESGAAQRARSALRDVPPESSE